MKKIISSRTLLCGALMMIPALAQAQQFNAASQNMTFALVETYTAPALQMKDDSGKPARDENGRVIRELVYSNEFSVDTIRNGDVVRTVSTVEEASKMETFRISNREILEDLRNKGKITSITGYSIAFVSADGGEDGEDFVYRIELQKRGESPIDVTEFFELEMRLGSAEADTYRSVTTEDNLRETMRTVETGGGRGKQRIGLSMSYDGMEVFFTGVFNWRDTLRTLTDRLAGETYTLYVPAAGRINSINGYTLEDGSEDDDSDDEAGLIEGTINLSAGTLVIRDFGDS